MIRRPTVLLLTLTLFHAHSFAIQDNLKNYKKCEGRLTDTSDFSDFLKTPDDEDEGFVTQSYPLTTESIVAAYRLGLFPWSVTPEGNAKWYSFVERGILKFSELDIPKSDRNYIKKMQSQPGNYRVTFNQAFKEVIRQCASVPRQDGGTWISEPFVEAWIELHQKGLAHSVEVWNGDQLVAGNYGTLIGGVYSGESMFHLESNVAKLAFYALIEHLRSKGHLWIDTQMAIGLTEKWGARLVSREEYQSLLRETQKLNLSF